MDPLRALIEAWPRELSGTLEMMTGASAEVSLEPAEAAAGALWWQNTFNSDPPMSLAVGADPAAWRRIGTAILQAAGIDPVDQAEAQSTWFEVLEQAASSSARRVAAAGGRPVECATGREIAQPAGQAFRAAIRTSDGNYVLSIAVTVDQSNYVPPQLPVAAPSVPVNPPASRTSPASRTMDALLDVQLPVSISFGNARVPLRDVLKLTTGSVVELNRQPEDPVDIIVNDCVIARGEVVVVDGNYAVRIQKIIGRQQRMGLRPDRADSGVLS